MADYFLYVFFIGAVFCVGQLLRTWWTLSLEEMFFSDVSRPPQSEELRGAISAERARDFSQHKAVEFVVKVIGPKAKAGLLQEESVLTAVEDFIFPRVCSLRELSAAAILSGLILTFWTLHAEFTKFQLRDGGGGGLAPILQLLGATWPLIGLGLVANVSSSIREAINSKRFDLYRRWLEAEIFPRLGASRTTADRLEAALTEFNRTTAGMKSSLEPLQGLGASLSRFQGDMVTMLVPTLQAGLKNVSVGLSEAAASKLTANSDAAAHVLKTVQDHQSRMLALLTQAERRSAQLVSVVESVAQHSSGIATSLGIQANHLLASTSASRDLSEALNQTSLRLEGRFTTLENRLSALEGCLDLQTRSSDSTNLTLAALLNTLRQTEPAVKELCRHLQSILHNSDQLSDVVTKLRSEIQPIIPAVATVAGRMADFNTRAIGMQDRWQEAMLQMSTLAEEFGSRTKVIDDSARELTTILQGSTKALEGLDDRGKELVSNFGEFRQAAVLVTESNKQLGRTFEDLQAVGQKLKHLGNSVTGHFSIWQRDTKDVFKKAQDAALSIEQSLSGVGRAVSGIESVNQAAETLSRRLAEVVELGRPALDARVNGSPAHGELRGDPDFIPHSIETREENR